MVAATAAARLDAVGAAQDDAALAIGDVDVGAALREPALAGRHDVAASAREDDERQNHALHGALVAQI